MTDERSPTGGDRNTFRSEYLSFLLRLRRVNADGAPAWRASLQRPGAAEAVVFTTLEALLDFLRAEMEEEDALQRPERLPPS